MMLVRNFSLMITLSFLISCDPNLNRIEVQLSKTIDCADSYDTFSAELIDLDNNKTLNVPVSSSGEFELNDLGDQNYQLNLYGFKDGIDSAVGFKSYKFSYKNGFYDQPFALLSPAEIIDSRIMILEDSVVSYVRWQYDNCSRLGVKKLYASEDSTSVFKEENLVKVGGDEHTFSISNAKVYFGLKLEYSNYNTESGYVYSPIWSAQYSGTQNYVEPDTWVDFEFGDTYTEHWYVNAVKDSWYVLEAFDAKNGNLTGEELVMFVNDGTREIRTRKPDGCMHFVKASTDLIKLKAALGYPGTKGTFRFRLRSINPTNIQALEGQHLFTENSQIIYTERQFDAGTYNIKTYQNDILNEAYVYYSILQNNEFLESYEFSAPQITNNIGPNSRDDTTTQNNVITFPTSGTVQMVMISSYHQTPGSFFVEIE